MTLPSNLRLPLELRLRPFGERPQDDRARRRAGIEHAARSLAETARPSDLGDEVDRAVAPVLGGDDERVERGGEALAVRRRRGESLQRRRVSVDQRLVANLGVADRLDFFQTIAKHPLEGGGVDVVDAFESVGETREHHAVERAHRSADLRHQHIAERRQRSRERLRLAAQPIRRKREPFGHIHAVIAVADQAVDVAQIGAVLDDPLGDRQNDVATACVGEALHWVVSYSGAGQATSTASSSLSSLSSAMIVRVAPTISRDVKKLPT